VFVFNHLVAVLYVVALQAAADSVAGVAAAPDLLASPPSDRAAMFAPWLVGSPDKEHGKLTVSRDGRTLYWDCAPMPLSAASPQFIACAVARDGVWRGRSRAAFSGPYKSWSTCLWGDDRILFGSERAAADDTLPPVRDYWLVERRGDGWSEPRPLGFDRFTDALKWTFSVTDDGAVYFDARMFPDGQYGWGMYVSRLVDGGYTEPVRLPAHLNTEAFDWNPFVAPDESYLLFASNRPGSLGSTDIYVAFRDAAGRWSQALNLGGRVNSQDLERFPSVSGDGRALFFLRDYVVGDELKEQDYYWIDAGIVAALRESAVWDDDSDAGSRD